MRGRCTYTFRKGCGRRFSGNQIRSSSILVQVFKVNHFLCRSQLEVSFFQGCVCEQQSLILLEQILLNVFRVFDHNKGMSNLPNLERVPFDTLVCDVTGIA